MKGEFQIQRFNACDICIDCGDKIPWVMRKFGKWYYKSSASSARPVRFIRCAPCTSKIFALRRLPIHLRGIR